MSHIWASQFPSQRVISRQQVMSHLKESSRHVPYHVPSEWVYKSCPKLCPQQVTSHLDESCHVQRSHVTGINANIMSHVWTSHAPSEWVLSCTNQSHHTYKCKTKCVSIYDLQYVMSHVWTSHVPSEHVMPRLIDTALKYSFCRGYMNTSICHTCRQILCENIRHRIYCHIITYIVTCIVPFDGYRNQVRFCKVYQII